MPDSLLTASLLERFLRMPTVTPESEAEGSSNLWVGPSETSVSVTAQVSHWDPQASLRSDRGQSSYREQVGTREEGLA